MAKGGRTARQFASVLLGAVIGLLGLVSGATLAHAQAVTIRYADFQLAEEPTATAFRQQVAEFEKENPGIKVQLEPAPLAQYPARIVAQAKAGQAPDVIHLFDGWMASWISEGFLLKLDPYIEKAGGETFAKLFYETPYKLATQRGSVYAVPRFAGGYMLQYNTRLFREAGLDPSRPPQTMKELLEYAAKLTKKDATGNTVQWGIGLHGKNIPADVSRFVNWIWAFGGEVVTADYTQSALESPKTIEALTFWSELYTKHGYAPPGSVQAGPGEVRSLFAQRKVAMMLSILWGLDLVAAENPEIRGETMFAPFPKQDAQAPVGFQSVYDGVSATSKHPEAAWKLIEHFAKKRSQIIAYQIGHVTPARIDAFLDPEVQKDPFARVAAKVSERLRPLPPIPEWTKISDVLGQMIQQALTKVKTPADAVKEAHARVNAILKK